jgi:hypothetical protein
MAKRKKTKLEWISLMGRYEVLPDGLKFKGGSLKDVDGQPGTEVGNFICNQSFGSGRISATIEFKESAEDSALGLILYHHTKSNGFVSAQLGGPDLCSIRSWGGQEWTIHASHGPSAQLRANKPYSFSAEVRGSQVSVEIDGIRTLSANLPYLLPRGQAGIFAIGRNDIIARDFRVLPKSSKLFVVMQYTPPYNVS